MKRNLKFNVTYIATVLTGVGLLFLLDRCTTTTGKADSQPQLPALPVVALSNIQASTYQEFPAMVEGKVNVEIRPQVDGYLEHIYVDEGAYVKAGQPLFRINDRPYREQVANSDATLSAAKANMERAQLEVDRLTPLVQNNVVSDVQLKTAQANLQAAKAQVSQAQAMSGNAQINLGYTIIKAPVNGYIGRIPMKIGSLVGRGEAQPLTVLSEVDEVYAYFSMSEVDFLEFKERIPGQTLVDKIRNVPAVELVLADGSVYEEKGRIETVEGQFDKTMGAISFRAIFPNHRGLLRSGNTGRIRIPRQYSQTIAVPQEATFELQDKVLVFVLADSNKVVSKPIAIEDQSQHYYYVKSGVSEGDKIVFTGLSRLRDGARITPQVVTMDSLLKIRPL